MTTSPNCENARQRDPAPRTIDTGRRRINSHWTPTERRCRAILAVAKQFVLFDQLSGRLAQSG